MSTVKVKNRYNYELFEKALNVWSTRNNPPYTRALRKLKFEVLSGAWNDFEIWAPKTDKELAMSYAWEDAIVAFSGYGQSCFTGVILDLWMSVPRDQWDEFQNFLNAAMLEAEWATPKTAPRRYLSKYRQLRMRTPQDGFDLPAAVPVWGPRWKEWAASNGMDPDESECQMREIEEYERMGLIELGNELPEKPEEAAIDIPAPNPVPELEHEPAPIKPPPVTSKGKRSKARLTLVHSTDTDTAPESK